MSAVVNKMPLADTPSVMCGLGCAVCVRCVELKKSDCSLFPPSSSWVRLELKHKEGVPALDETKLKTYVEFL